MPTCSRCHRTFDSAHELTKHRFVDHLRQKMVDTATGASAEPSVQTELAREITAIARANEDAAAYAQSFDTSAIYRGGAVAGIGAALAVPSGSEDETAVNDTRDDEDDGLSRRSLLRTAAIGGAGALVAGPAVARVNAQDPIEISDWHELAHIGDDTETEYPLDGDYVLVADLDAGVDGYADHAGPDANDGDGWAPIGDDDDPFTGTFDGNGHTIADLVIERPDENYIGLFGMAIEASVTNLTVEGTINGYADVGGLVGVVQGGNYIDVHTDIELTSQNCCSGGLIGWSFEPDDGHLLIEDCSTHGDITDYACCTGGIAGWIDNATIVRNTHATGDLWSDGCCSGGLFGWTQGATVIEDCSQEGEVVDDCCLTGGIAGWFGIETEVYNTVAHGDVICGEEYGGCCSGGLAGYAFGTTTIENSHAMGDVLDYYGLTGGLLGWIEGDATVSNSTARGNVTTVDGFDTTGGFVGGIWGGMVVDSVASGDVTSQGEEATLGGFAGQVTEGHAHRTAAYGDVSSEGDLVGGYAGVITDTVTESYATGSVSSTTDGVGGFAAVVGDDGLVDRAYARGDATGNDGVGGFVAGIFEEGMVSEAYSVGIPTTTGDETVAGGFVAVTENGVTDGYWDEQASETSTSAGGTPLTTEQMTGDDAPGHMAGFDFEDTWVTQEDEYPVFGWQDPEDVTCVPRREAGRDTPEELICQDDRELGRDDTDGRGRRDNDERDDRRDWSR